MRVCLSITELFFGTHTLFAAPSIDALQPSQGPQTGGNTITLVGSNFGNVPSITHVTWGTQVFELSATNPKCSLVGANVECAAPAYQGSSPVPVTITVDEQDSTPMYPRNTIANIFIDSPQSVLLLRNGTKYIKCRGEHSTHQRKVHSDNYGKFILTSTELRIALSSRRRKLHADCYSLRKICLPSVLLY